MTQSRHQLVATAGAGMSRKWLWATKRAISRVTLMSAHLFQHADEARKVIKTFTGYHLAPGIAPADHDTWFATSYAPACLANPHLDELVFNTVRGTVRGEQTYYGIEERHFANAAALDAFQGEYGKDGSFASRAQNYRLTAFSVRTDVVNVDRTNVDEMIINPAARVATRIRQPREKSVLGYDIVSTMTVEDYEAWLWDIHSPDLLINPHLERIVFNTVTGTVGGDETFFRISELHIKDKSSDAAWAKWHEENPVSVDRSPLGKTDFRFYVLVSVDDLRPDSSKAATEV